MGQEAQCTLRFGRTKAKGKALLETEALIFRGGEVRLSVPYRQITAVAARAGALHVSFPEGTAVFEIGAVAEKWADRILHPPSRIDKLGVKSGHRVALLGLDDPAFARELEARGATVATRIPGGADLIFLAAARRDTLAKLRLLPKRLKADGAIWVVRPRGSAAITERDVMQAGKAAGLVDVKVVRFSDTHTAEKFVIPLARRSAR